MWIEMILIFWINCYIIDISGIILSIKKGIWKIFNKNIKYRDFSMNPFECSTCMNFWIILFFCLFGGYNLLYSLSYASLFSFLSIQGTNLLKTIHIIIQNIISKLYGKF